MGDGDRSLALPPPNGPPPGAAARTGVPPVASCLANRYSPQGLLPREAAAPARLGAPARVGVVLRGPPT